MTEYLALIALALAGSVLFPLIIHGLELLWDRLPWSYRQRRLRQFVRKTDRYLES